jgi:hypothetical protein
MHCARFGLGLIEVQDGLASTLSHFRFHLLSVCLTLGVHERQELATRFLDGGGILPPPIHLTHGSKESYLDRCDVSQRHDMGCSPMILRP